MSPFIVIEGIDGTGKSTQAKLLASTLNALTTSFPHKDDIVVREYLGKKDSVPFEAFHYRCLSQMWNDASFIEDEDTGLIVCDRFWPSNVAYAKAVKYPEWSMSFLLKSVQGLPSPTRAILLDGDPAVLSKKRLSARAGEGDVFDVNMELQERARDAYWEVYESTKDAIPWIVVTDVHVKSIDQVHQEILQQLMMVK